MLGSIRERRLFFFFSGGLLVIFDRIITFFVFLIFILLSGLWDMAIAFGVLGIFLTATAH